MGAPASAVAAPSPSGPAASAPPWWATQLFHLVIGISLLISGVILEVFRPTDIEGGILIGSSLTFLGVGAGIGVQTTVSGGTSSGP